MIKTLKLSECLPVINASRTDVENWLSRLDLMTVYAQTVAGSPRLYSCDNVLELAGIAALTKIGVPARNAPAFAFRFFVETSGLSGREWLIFDPQALVSDAGSNLGFVTDKLNGKKLADFAAKAGKSTVFAVVHAGEIVRNVRALFAVEKVEA